MRRIGRDCSPSLQAAGLPAAAGPYSPRHTRLSRAQRPSALRASSARLGLWVIGLDRNPSRSPALWARQIRLRWHRSRYRGTLRKPAPTTAIRAPGFWLIRHGHGPLSHFAFSSHAQIRAASWGSSRRSSRRRDSRSSFRCFRLVVVTIVGFAGASFRSSLAGAVATFGPGSESLVAFQAFRDERAW